MRPIVIGLVDNTARRVDQRKMQAAVTALNIQVTKHLRKCWSTVPPAIVRHLDVDLKDPNTDTPPGVWPIILMDHLEGTESGFHSTLEHLQPYAEVVVKDDDWTITASHEVLEMLVDPSGNRLQAARAIECADGRIADCAGDALYVLEVCDPCEAKTFAYRIDETWVSDFVTPDFYACVAVPGTHYSFRHNIELPRRILPGGYISWVDPRTRHIRQIIWLHKDEKMRFVDRVAPGGAPGTANLRAHIDMETRRNHPLHDHCGKVPGKLYGEKRALPPGKEGLGPPNPVDKDHWVTYHDDGLIERKIYENGSEVPSMTCFEVVKAHEPILRAKYPKGTRHKVTNIGYGPIFFDKDLIGPGDRT